MTTVFLDTVGLIAMWNRTDQWHAIASAAYRQLCLERTRMVTTSLILLECGNEAARRPYRSEVVKLREELALGSDLYEPTPDEVDQAWRDYGRGQAGDASTVDYISFAVMRRLGMTRAFTNDAHFRAAGFETLF